LQPAEASRNRTISRETRYLIEVKVILLKPTFHLGPRSCRKNLASLFRNQQVVGSIPSAGSTDSTVSEISHHCPGAVG
jgi:hypothetical protein